jgi:hypothetical protein
MTIRANKENESTHKQLVRVSADKRFYFYPIEIDDERGHLA